MVLELTGPLHGTDSDQMALLPCTSTEPALWAGAGLETLSHRGPERLQGHGCPRQGDTAMMQYPLVEACCDPTVSAGVSLTFHPVLCGWHFCFRLVYCT